MPPVDAVSVPADDRVPVAFGRSPSAIGPFGAPPHVVQPVANTPFNPSDSTPTRTPVPSTPNCWRATSAAMMLSPSVVTDPIRRTA